VSEAAPAAAATAAWARHLGGEVDPLALRAQISEGGLAAALAEASAVHCESPGLTIDGFTATHCEIDAAAARVAGWLAHQGIRPGDRVLISGPSSHELVRSILAVFRCGATAVPVDAGATAHELGELAADCAPRAAFVSAQAAMRLAELPAELCPGTVVGLERGAAQTFIGDATASPIGPSDAGAPPLLAYTSGTTGKPKGVPLSDANLLSSLRGVMLSWRWAAEDVVVHALPLSHQHGLGGVLAALLSGSHAVVAPRFDPKTFCSLLEEHSATIMLAVPALYERLDGWRGICTAPLRSLRLAVSGSAPLPRSLAERVGTWLGELPLERYGSTEAGLVLSNLYDGPRRAGSVGYPLPGIEARIADPEGAELPDGADGEVQIRGPQVFAGYLGREDATAEAFTADGWFRSGDVGRVDPADGSFSITGRIKEMIISGGLNVFPAEVEAALEGAPGIAAVAVAGVPSRRWGEEVVAFAVASGADEIDAESVIAHCRERLSAHKCPKRVVQVADLPRNEMGKLRRDQLAALADTEKKKEN
jgi:malonyl-CoA/methylmalonyl-CoA synthetase